MRELHIYGDENYWVMRFPTDERVLWEYHTDSAERAEEEARSLMERYPDDLVRIMIDYATSEAL